MDLLGSCEYRARPIRCYMAHRKQKHGAARQLSFENSESIIARAVNPARYYRFENSVEKSNRGLAMIGRHPIRIRNSGLLM